MAIKIGDPVPSFSGKDQNGNTINITDYIGKKIVLYFYPKDNTPGCTTQSCNLRDNYQMLQNNGFTVIGISCDSEKSHQKFITKYELPFPLIADEDQKIVNLFGVWIEKSMYGKTYMGIARTTFIIDEDQKIIDIIAKVDTKDHTSQIVKQL